MGTCIQCCTVLVNCRNMGTYTEIILSVRKRVESNNKVINGSNVTETSSEQPLVCDQ